MPDGVYRLAEEGAGVAVDRASGGKLSLGALAAKELGPVEIEAMNNENTRYQFRFPQAGPLKEGSGDGRLAILLGGFAEPVGSQSEPDERGRQDLSSWVDDRAVAENWAKTLKVDLPERKHPGHRLLTTFEPLRENYRPGEPVELRMAIRNVGPAPFAFTDGGQQRGPRNNQFRFIAWKGYDKDFAMLDKGDRTNFGGMAGVVELNPGETFEKRVNLTDWFRFEDADSYSVTGLFEIQLIEPGAQTFRPIWDDFAVGTCSVTVAAAASSTAVESE
jgi:hypothetical protein